MTAVLVTGAVGNVGREVVRAVQACGLHVRAAVADEGRARQVLGARVELVPFDYSVPATYACADGVDHIFLMRPPAIANVAGVTRRPGEADSNRHLCPAEWLRRRDRLPRRSTGREDPRGKRRRGRLGIVGGGRARSPRWPRSFARRRASASDASQP